MNAIHKKLILYMCLKINIKYSNIDRRLLQTSEINHV